MTTVGLRSRRVYSNLPGLYDIDKTLFSKGTLGTLLSYRELLRVRVRNRVSSQQESQPSEDDTVIDSKGPTDSVGFEIEGGSVTLRFYLEVLGCLSSVCFPSAKIDSLSEWIGKQRPIHHSPRWTHRPQEAQVASW